MVRGVHPFRDEHRFPIFFFFSPSPWYDLDPSNVMISIYYILNIVGYGRLISNDHNRQFNRWVW